MGDWVFVLIINSLHFWILFQTEDIFLTPIQHIPQRAEMMDFTSPIQYGEIMMFYRDPAPLISPWVLFNPLSTGFLVAIVICLVTLTFILFAMEVYAPFSKQHNVTKQQKIKMRPTKFVSRYHKFINVFQNVVAVLLSKG